PSPYRSSWPRSGGDAEGAREPAVLVLSSLPGFDVLNGKLEGPLITDGRHSDKRSPLSVEELPEGSLVIADLGFCSVARFSQIARPGQGGDRKSTRLNSSHQIISYAVFCLKKKI